MTFDNLDSIRKQFRSAGNLSVGSVRRLSLRVLWIGCLAWVALWIGANRPASAQSLWEVTPYRVRVWWVAPPDARLPERVIRSCLSEIQRRATSQWGAAVEVVVERVPQRWNMQVRRGDLPALREWFDQEEMIRQVDKLMLVRVKPDSAYTVSVSTQQFDLATLTEGVAISQDSIQTPDLSTVALHQMAQTFTPLVRLEKVEDQQVRGEIRAGALLRPESSRRYTSSPFLIEKGQVLTPAIRRADRYGRVAASGIQPVDWTLLTVQNRESSRVTCVVDSGFRQPFHTRRSTRVEQLATLVQIPFAQTTLRLINRANPDEELGGYEVYRRNGEDDASELVGRTDWRGELVIQADPNGASQTLFVKSGQQLLAKLPLVPGAKTQVTAALRNDARRLEAEGFLLGVQDSLLDLVARREVLVARVRQKMDAGNWEEAQTLFTELQQLDSKDEFVRRIQQRKQSLTAVDAQIQRKIDQLFADTGALLNRFLAPGQIDELNRQLQEAKRTKTTSVDNSDSP